MEKNSNSGALYGGLFGALAGIAIGVAGKLIYDEVSKDPKAEENQRAKEFNMNKRSKIEIEERAETNHENIEDPEYETFFCPICLEVMRDPVITPQGISFERKAIIKWLRKNDKCPITKASLKEHDLITNYALKGTIEDYFRKQKETKNGK
jgi:hypothetical protein